MYVLLFLILLVFVFYIIFAKKYGISIYDDKKDTNNDKN